MRAEPGASPALGASGPPAAAQPLRGLAVALASPAPEALEAASVLVGLGARLAEPPRPADLGLAVAPEEVPAPAGARLEPSPLAPGDHPGLPAGAAVRAAGLALAAGALAGALGGRRLEVAGLDVSLALYLPLVMAASYDAPAPAAPPRPRPAPGGGALACDLGSPGDAEAFDRLLATLPPDADAETVASAAQLWRLPVCPYRRRPEGHPPSPLRGSSVRRHLGQPVGQRAPAPATPPLAGVVVLDFTVMWAGPLATWLLGRLGATVLKVEPDCRLDGFRALDGRGIHPGGACRRPGEDSALFHALNGGKRRLALDLRIPEHRDRVFEALRSSDVVLDSFSPRVAGNLGLSREVLCGDDPGRLTVSMPAFPPGPERHWVAYGTGVHAASGLGTTEDGRAVPPAVSYPDPLGGLQGCVTALAGLLGRRRGWEVAHLEASLLEACRPLLRADPSASTLGRPVGDLGQALFDLGRRSGALAEAEDAAGRHHYPLGPFRGPGLPLPLEPAPGLGARRDP